MKNNQQTINQVNHKINWFQKFLMVCSGGNLHILRKAPSEWNKFAGIVGIVLFTAVFAGFAAIGFGILLGTIAKTQEQSAPFGATSVVILAAVGGVWVPVFAMPKIMQVIAGISPMNWGLNAFYDVILRNATFLDIIPEISYLFLFFIAMISISLFYDEKKRAV